MNYIEYKMGEMINDNSDDIVRFLQRHLLLPKSQHAILQMVTQFITIIGRYELN